MGRYHRLNGNQEQFQCVQRLVLMHQNTLGKVKKDIKIEFNSISLLRVFQVLKK